MSPPPSAIHVPRGTKKLIRNWPDQPYENDVEVIVPPPSTCTPLALARVAGRTCYRSMSEMEHVALKLIAEHAGFTGQQDLVAFLEDAVRLARQVGDLPAHATGIVRPGTWTGP